MLIISLIFLQFYLSFSCTDCLKIILGKYNVIYINGCVGTKLNKTCKSFSKRMEWKAKW